MYTVANPDLLFSLTHIFSVFVNRLGLFMANALFFFMSQTHSSKQLKLGNRGTVASVVIQAIGSGTNEETLMKATHPMIRIGQFGAKLV